MIKLSVVKIQKRSKCVICGGSTIFHNVFCPLAEMGGIWNPKVILVPLKKQRVPKSAWTWWEKLTHRLKRELRV